MITFVASSNIYCPARSSAARSSSCVMSTYSTLSIPAPAATCHHIHRFNIIRAVNEISLSLKALIILGTVVPTSHQTMSGDLTAAAL